MPQIDNTLEWETPKEGCSFAQKVIKENIAIKTNEFNFQDYSDYSDSDNYGDSSGDWT